MATLALRHTQPASRTAPESDVALAAAGDREAFERLYRANSGRVFALCIRMVGDRSNAEELTQDVFVRAWGKLSQFRGDASFSTWLHRLAVNVVLEDRRATMRRIARVEPTNDPATMERVARSTTNDERMDIEAAIAALPEKTRHVFVLHDIEGYRHEEISRLTGAAQGTVRAQLFRARRMLMEALSR
jgi:RNA polymerase sigma-70 factor, ECF subfamily